MTQKQKLLVWWSSFSDLASAGSPHSSCRIFQLALRYQVRRPRQTRKSTPLKWRSLLNSGSSSNRNADSSIQGTSALLDTHQQIPAGQFPLLLLILKKNPELFLCVVLILYFSSSATLKGNRLLLFWFCLALNRVVLVWKEYFIFCFL